MIMWYTRDQSAALTPVGAFFLEEQPDVVIGPSVPLFTAWAASCIAKLKDAAFVFEVRDIWPQALVDLGKMTHQGLAFRVLRSLEKKIYKKG